MGGVRRALAFSLIERYALLVIGLAGNMLLARLLTPEEIGLYSVTLAVIGIAQVLRDFGIGTFLIQLKEVRPAQVHTAFTMSLLLGGGLFLLAFIAAPYVAAFYHSAELTTVMRVGSANFVVLAFCAVPLAMMRRRMEFKRLAAIALAATVMGTVVTVALAALSWGALCMAIGALVTNVITAAAAWMYESRSTSVKLGLSEWRSLLSFGAQSSSASIITSVSVDINDLALGKILGFAPVAMISKAQGIMNLFHRDMMSAIKNVALPAFAQAARTGATMESPYIMAVAMLTAVAWPFYAFAALYAHELVMVLFGPQWGEAVRLVPVFCLAGAIAAAALLVPSLMVACGRIDLSVRAEIVFQPLRALIVVASALTWKSLLACAIAFAVGMVAYLPIMYFAKQRCVPSDWRRLASALGKSVLVTALALPVPAWLAHRFGGEAGLFHNLVLLAIAGCTLGIGWVVAVVAVNHPLAADAVFARVLGPFARCIRSIKQAASRTR